MGVSIICLVKPTSKKDAKTTWIVMNHCNPSFAEQVKIVHINWSVRRGIMGIRAKVHWSEIISELGSGRESNIFEVNVTTRDRAFEIRLSVKPHARTVATYLSL